jgi:hypothetical protein
MSLFQTETARCPYCDGSIAFEVVYSVNADRRPDLRAQILDGSFQRETCAGCGKPMRMQPNFAYVDVGRGQWILVEPSAGLATWPELEAAAKETFAIAYGEEASRLAREIGRGLVPRVTFGWAALREKLVCGEAGLDDVALECTKMLMLRGLNEVPMADDVDLRLVEVAAGDRAGDPAGDLVFAWLRSSDEVGTETLTVPRALYAGVAGEPEAWAALRGPLAGGLYVDLNRLLVPADGTA